MAVSRTFRVWAPAAQAVSVVVDPDTSDPDVDGHEHPLRSTVGGWWEVSVDDVAAGVAYGFTLDGGPPRKDPRSAHQPDGAHGLSRTYDHADFRWTDSSWSGIALADAVLYELHVGTFTPEGTFDAAITHLDHLAELSVTAVEVMPVNGFDGDRGWGYDGVDLFAVQHSYGGPDAFKRFVDAAHARGLAVVLDVVYNHLGPSGNLLSQFGPYFTDAHETPWGRAVNLDQPGSGGTRAFFVDNALQWLRDFHCDGLRLDAVHALVDDSTPSFLAQLSQSVDELATATGHQRWLIAESDLNDPALITARADGGAGLSGMWADDLHHSVHSVLTGERDGYYADYGPFDDIARCWTGGYTYAGRFSVYRGHEVGKPLPPGVPAWRIVVALQNHDQIGNRAVGERMSQLVSDDRCRVGAAIVLLSPMTPLLYMGEEWAAQTPWQFFAGHTDPELQDAVRTGRRREFASFGWDPEAVPDPEDPATRDASVLDWDEVDGERGQAMLAWYRRLLELRRTETDLCDGRLDRAAAACDEQAGWLALRRGALAVVVNLGAQRQAIPVEQPVIELLACSGTGYAFSPVDVTLDADTVAVVRLALT